MVFWEKKKIKGKASILTEVYEPTQHDASILVPRPNLLRV